MWICLVCTNGYDCQLTIKIYKDIVCSVEYNISSNELTFLLEATKIILDLSALLLNNG